MYVYLERQRDAHVTSMIITIFGPGMPLVTHESMSLKRNSGGVPTNKSPSLGGGAFLCDKSTHWLGIDVSNHPHVWASMSLDRAISA